MEVIPKLFVYIAGPYTNPDPVLNVRAAVLAAERLWASGLIVPLIPHLTMLAHLVSPHDLDYWYELDIAQMIHTEAVLRLPGASTGADAEVDEALVRGMPVFYEEIDVIMHARRVLDA